MQASKLVSARVLLIRGTAAADKLAEIKKEPNRKAVAAPEGGPPGVLLPFLAEDLRVLYHTHCHPGKSPPV